MGEGRGLGASGLPAIHRPRRGQVRTPSDCPDQRRGPGLRQAPAQRRDPLKELFTAPAGEPDAELVVVIHWGRTQTSRRDQRDDRDRLFPTTSCTERHGIGKGTTV